MGHVDRFVAMGFTALLLLGVGCRDASTAEASANEPPRLRAILVSDQTPVTHRPLDLSTRSDQVIRTALLAPGRFSSAGVDDHSACAAEVDIMYALVVNGTVVVDAPAGVARMVIEGHVHCLIPGGSGDDTESFREEVADEAAYGAPGQASGRVTLEGMLHKLGDTLASHLHGQVMMRHATDAQLLTALETQTSPGVLMEAASEAGERNLKGALSSLVALTRHPNDTVALRAAASVGRLGAGDEASVRALAAMTRGSDLERHLVAIQALGDLGGPRAARYLDTLADGHPEVGIRAAARAAAARARARSELE